MAIKTTYECDLCGKQSEDLYAFSTISVTIETPALQASNERILRLHGIYCNKPCLDKQLELAVNEIDGA